ncbi:uncharacterized protein LOC144825001 [Lissotriton helveticus]
MNTIPIFNLSSHNTNSATLAVLSRGLSFVPHSGLNKFELFNDMISFFRKIRLKNFFSHQECELPEPNRSGLSPKSIFTPSLDQVDPEIGIFEKIVTSKLQNITKYIPRTPYNISIDEHNALLQLKESTQTIVKSCDKGGGIAIFDTTNYIEKMVNMLSDTKYYSRITKDPTSIIKNKITRLISKALGNGDICQKEHDYMNIGNPKMASIYGIPKVHKNEQDPPLRPIVTTIGSVTEPISKYIDAILRPHIEKIPGHIKDTRHVITQFEDTSFNAHRQWMVTLDVESLYSNIPCEGAMEATKWFIESFNIDCNMSFILDCLQIILDNNIFEFAGQLYKQIRGVSMGASCAPTIANIYVALFEEKFIFNEVAPFFESIFYWSRFIDDIIFIWDDNEDVLQEFVSWLNACDPNLKFTEKMSNSEIEFLDLNIKHHEGKLIMDLFTKPTARNTLLHYSSFHPSSQKDSIPFSQFLRLRRNCTRLTDYDQRATVMKEKFLERGYPHRLIRDSFKRARYYDRQHLLTGTNVKRDASLVFVTRHSMLNKQIQQILYANWHILNVNKSGNEIINKPLFAYKKNKNIKDIVVRSRMPTQKAMSQRDIITGAPVIGNHRCGICKICPLTIETAEFTFNNITIPLLTMTNCKTTNIVYLLICPCNKGYVGESSRSVCTRITEHKSAIRTRKINAPLVSHYLDKDHKPEDIQWVVLEKIVAKAGINIDKIRRKREVFWIFTLDTFKSGLNSKIPWQQAIL